MTIEVVDFRKDKRFHSFLLVKNSISFFLIECALQLDEKFINYYPEGTIKHFSFSIFRLSYRKNATRGISQQHPRRFEIFRFYLPMSFRNILYSIENYPGKGKIECIPFSIDNYTPANPFLNPFIEGLDRGLHLPPFESMDLSLDLETFCTTYFPVDFIGDHNNAVS